MSYATIEDMRDRVVVLLERNFYNTVTNFKAVRFWLLSEEDLHESQHNIMRKQLIFGFRAVSTKDISDASVVLSRLNAIEALSGNYEDNFVVYLIGGEQVISDSALDVIQEESAFSFPVERLSSVSENGIEVSDEEAFERNTHPGQIALLLNKTGLDTRTLQTRIHQGIREAESQKFLDELGRRLKDSKGLLEEIQTALKIETARKLIGAISDERVLNNLLSISC